MTSDSKLIDVDGLPSTLNETYQFQQFTQLLEEFYELASPIAAAVVAFYGASLCEAIEEISNKPFSAKDFFMTLFDCLDTEKQKFLDYHNKQLN